MRPAPGTSARYVTEAYLREVEAEQAVKGNPTLDRRAAGRRSHHEPPGEQLAYSGGSSLPPNLKTAPDQQRRALTTGSSTPLGVSTRSRRSTGRCGWTVFLASTRQPADGKSVWRKCQWRGCSHCGPELRERNLTHDIGNMAGQQMTRRVVAAKVWPAVREKIKRAGGLRVYYPQPGGMLAVYATAGLVGEVVADHAQALASDYRRIPNGKAIRRSREWALNPKASTGSKTWRQLGTSAVTDRVPWILRDLGLYRGEVDEGAVPLEAWEVHNFTVPPRHTSEFARFVDAFDLKRRRRVAA
jgi:hypothetical protein